MFRTRLASGGAGLTDQLIPNHSATENDAVSGERVDFVVSQLLKPALHISEGFTGKARQCISIKLSTIGRQVPIRLAVVHEAQHFHPQTASSYRAKA
ncbi:hypothetical protein KFK14_11420 [Sphingobium phenoxybenzoativorans]|uniref:Uncharacterized protein n=1 Tax=Sphingobium phenoxybenzoativorans TaxID=1592790 RepID=A0A975KC25_9SPHN|nr:hypothetical protein [Sphingobium phenoxybenzoativorans]QUT07938.1 hypothetical protein KFK14_11420 [Sphingobium phenoxybenzoativorans]